MSAVKISKNPYLPFIQTNAVNQGSSGGALIDAQTKQLIGINKPLLPIGLNIVWICYTFKLCVICVTIIRLEY